MKKTEIFKIDGMKCGGCSKSLHSALMDSQGVFEAKVSHEEGTAEITHTLPDTVIMEIITSAGYQPLGKTDSPGNGPQTRPVMAHRLAR